MSTETFFWRDLWENDKAQKIQIFWKKYTMYLGVENGSITIRWNLTIFLILKTLKHIQDTQDCIINSSKMLLSTVDNMLNICTLFLLGYLTI